MAKIKAPPLTTQTAEWPSGEDSLPPSAPIRKNRRFAQTFDGPSVVQRHFRQQQDVNNIVARYKATGLDPYAARAGQQKFGYATSKSFSEALREVAAVETAFAELPSKVRADFENDPSQWLESMGTPVEGPLEIVPPEALQEVPPKADPPKTTPGG